MAQLETWYKQDLKKPLVVHRHADVFNQDSRGNLIGVEVYRDGEPVTLSGSIDGYCLLSDGTTVPAVGANRTGNKASILIPQTAYNVPGPITITIKNTDGNDITTLCAVVGLVRQSVSGNLVQPGDIVTDWSQSINAQLQAVQDAADNVGAIVAAPFAENTAYVVGNYVTYNGNLYRITADHAAGVTWANTAKTQCTVGTELYDLKSALNAVEKHSGTEFDITAVTFNNRYRINPVTGKRQGGSSSYETVCATDYVRIADFEKLKLTMRYMKSASESGSGIAFYSDSNETSFISGQLEPNSPDIEESTYKIVTVAVPENAKYMRTTWWSNSTEQYGEHAFELTGIIVGKIDDEIAEIKENVAEFDSFTQKIEAMSGTKDDISSAFVFSQGYRINAVTGERQSSKTRCASGFVDIEGFTHLFLTRCYTTELGASGLAFYTEEDYETIISGDIDAYDENLENATFRYQVCKVPQNAKFMRATWWKSDQPQYLETDFCCYGIVGKYLQDEIDDIKDEQNELWDAQSQIWNAVTELGSAAKLPDYYFTNGYIDNRVKAIIDLVGNRSIHGDIFYWFTDPHYFGYSGPSVYNGLNGPTLINYITERINIRKVFCGGDLIHGTGMTQATAIRNLEFVRKHLRSIWSNTFMLIGNHEWNNPNSSPEHMDDILPASVVYELLLKDKENDVNSIDSLGDYYIDNVQQKIRYLFVGCEYDSTISPIRLKWVANQLKTVPSDYTVVVLSHIGVNENGGIPNNSPFKPLANVLDAAKSKGSITVDGTAFDFSDFDATIACVIAGHNHYDKSLQTTGGIWVITTTCDRSKTSNSSIEFNTARALGTINEQAIDVYVIDTEAKKINTIRIGGSFDGTAPLENPDREFDYGE